jgi:hypothetical protein
MRTREGYCGLFWETEGHEGALQMISPFLASRDDRMLEGDNVRPALGQ